MIDDADEIAGLVDEVPEAPPIEIQTEASVAESPPVHHANGLFRRLLDLVVQGLRFLLHPNTPGWFQERSTVT